MRILPIAALAPLALVACSRQDAQRDAGDAAQNAANEAASAAESAGQAAAAAASDVGDAAQNAAASAGNAVENIGDHNDGAPADNSASNAPASGGY